MDAARTEPVLGDREAGAALAEQVGGGHAAVLVGDLPVAGPLVVAHHGHRAHAGEARRVDGHEDQARALVRRASGSVTTMAIASAAPL